MHLKVHQYTIAAEPAELICVLSTWCKATRVLELPYPRDWIAVIEYRRGAVVTLEIARSRSRFKSRIEYPM